MNQRIIPTFDQHAGLIFEEAPREYLARLARKGELDILPEQIGGWWDREAEIEVVAVSNTERSLLLGECKWSVKPVGTNILAELRQKAQGLLSLGEWTHVGYILFSKSGFTTALQGIAKDEGVRLVEAEEMIRNKNKVPV